MKLHPSLFEFVLGSPERRARAAAALTQDGLWPQALRLADAWRVLPQCAQAIRQQGVALDPDSAAYLRDRLIRAAAQSSYLARRATDLAASLDRHRIEAVAFKGVATLAHVHRSPAGRMLADIDLLVRESDLDGALQAIEQAGFRLGLEGSPEDARKLAERRVRSDNLTIGLVDAHDLEVDLHYGMIGGIANLLDDDFWARSAVRSLSGRTVRVVAPVDAVLLLTHHSLRTHFTPYPTVRDLVDLVAYWSMAPGAWTAAELAHNARRTRLDVPLLALLRILEEVGALADDDAALAALRADLGRDSVVAAEQLHRWFVERLQRPELGEEGLMDAFILLSQPGSLLRLFKDRVFARRRSTGEPWREQLEALRYQGGKNYLRRSWGVLCGLMRMSGSQWRSIRGVVRAQRRALSAVDPSSRDGR